MAADPDEGRTREAHSLVGDADAAIELIGHFPRRSKPVDINACRHAAVGFKTLYPSCSSSACSRRQREVFPAPEHRPGHARILGAMATTAFQ